MDPITLAALIGLGGTAIATGGAYGLNALQQKEQKKQRKLADKLAKQQAQRAVPTNIQQPTNQPGALPEVGGAGNIWTGYNAGAQQLPRFSPEQQSAMSQLLGQGLQNFNPDFLERRALQQFHGEIVPTIAERFTGMGAGNQGSSAFRGALRAAGSDVTSQLQALRAQVGAQQLGLGLQPQFENIYNPERQGLLQSGASALAPAATQLAGELASPWLKKYSDWVLGGGNQNQQQPQQQSYMPQYSPVPSPSFGSASSVNQVLDKLQQKNPYATNFGSANSVNQVLNNLQRR